MVYIAAFLFLMIKICTRHGVDSMAGGEYNELQVSDQAPAVIINTYVHT